MYIIITIDPLEQPGCYDITCFKTYDEVRNGLIDIITDRLEGDTDFMKVNYYKKIIDENLSKYKIYIDDNLSQIECGEKFSLKYYGYFHNQEVSNMQYDTIYNVHKID